MATPTQRPANVPFFLGERFAHDDCVTHLKDQLVRSRHATWGDLSDRWQGEVCDAVGRLAAQRPSQAGERTLSDLRPLREVYRAMRYDFERTQGVNSCEANSFDDKVVLCSWGLALPALVYFCIPEGERVMRLSLWAVQLGTLGAHEFAHALTADAMGDFLPRLRGKCTLNPLAFMSAQSFMSLSTVSLFKSIAPSLPVPYVEVDEQLMDRKFAPHRSLALVAAAGPAVNLAAWIAAQAAAYGVAACGGAGGFSATLLGTVANKSRTAFLINMVPFGICDGQKIVRGLMPHAWVATFDRCTNSNKAYGVAGAAALITAAAWRWWL